MRIGETRHEPPVLRSDTPVAAPAAGTLTGALTGAINRGGDDEAPSAFGRILRGLGREIDRGEALVGRAIHAVGAGGELGPSQLLALQAGVYRYSEAVDLSAKLVDRATNGVKTVIQGQ